MTCAYHKLCSLCCINIVLHQQALSIPAACRQAHPVRWLAPPHPRCTEDSWTRWQQKWKTLCPAAVAAAADHSNTSRAMDSPSQGTVNSPLGNSPMGNSSLGDSRSMAISPCKEAAMLQHHSTNSPSTIFNSTTLGLTLKVPHPTTGLALCPIFPLARYVHLTTLCTDCSAIHCLLVACEAHLHDIAWMLQVTISSIRTWCLHTHTALVDCSHCA